MVPIIWNMETYFLKCKKHTDDIDSKKITMTVTNKVIRNKSKCAVWMLLWVITFQKELTLIKQLRQKFMIYHFSKLRSCNGCHNILIMACGLKNWM